MRSESTVSADGIRAIQRTYFSNDSDSVTPQHPPTSLSADRESLHVDVANNKLSSPIQYTTIAYSGSALSQIEETSSQCAEASTVASQSANNDNTAEADTVQYSTMQFPSSPEGDNSDKQSASYCDCEENTANRSAVRLDESPIIQYSTMHFPHSRTDEIRSEGCALSDSPTVVLGESCARDGSSDTVVKTPGDIPDDHTVQYSAMRFTDNSVSDTWNDDDQQPDRVTCTTSCDGDQSDTPIQYASMLYTEPDNEQSETDPVTNAGPGKPRLGLDVTRETTPSSAPNTPPPPPINIPVIKSTPLGTKIQYNAHQFKSPASKRRTSDGRDTPSPKPTDNNNKVQYSTMLFPDSNQSCSSSA